MLFVDLVHQHFFFLAVFLLCFSHVCAVSFRDAAVLSEVRTGSNINIWIVIWRTYCSLVFCNRATYNKTSNLPIQTDRSCTCMHSLHRKLQHDHRVTWLWDFIAPWEWICCTMQYICESGCRSLAVCSEISSDNVSRMFRNWLVMLAFCSQLHC